jgi:hypothetical protein
MMKISASGLDTVLKMGLKRALLISALKFMQGSGLAHSESILDIFPASELAGIQDERGAVTIPTKYCWTEVSRAQRLQHTSNVPAAALSVR